MNFTPFADVQLRFQLTEGGAEKGKGTYVARDTSMRERVMNLYSEGETTREELGVAAASIDLLKRSKGREAINRNDFSFSL